MDVGVAKTENSYPVSFAPLNLIANNVEDIAASALPFLPTSHILGTHFWGLGAAVSVLVVNLRFRNILRNQLLGMTSRLQN
ncbi:hypothetical protein Pyn_32638 [Prunus yedoensis var. nudiflora]|uniref:Uncharacterized protein n=1 Tax=Prunus yedoensis var. nudiflora TaxID=2094558 RepID=A0A314ZQ85_PRUYE|nr:hypothetical protein Pyn_32638 [Prunus yedoensis var. nudiflora]